MAPLLDAIGLLRAELAPGVPLIGFAGAPFTLASYLVEGRASPVARSGCARMMTTRSRSWSSDLLATLTDMTIDVPARAGGGRRAGAPGVRLLGRARSVRARTSATSRRTCAGCSTISRGSWRPAHPFRDRQPGAAPVAGRGGRRRDRRRLAGAARARRGARSRPRCPTSRSAGQPGSGGAPRPVVR